KDLVALMKQKPDALTFGSSGPGSISHLATAMFLEEAGVRARHIPYQGPNPMTVGLIAGQIDFASQGLPVFQPHVKAGTLRAIGIYSAQRSPVAPEIPTFVEQGMPKAVLEAWVTLIGPKGVPAATVKKVNAAAVQALASAAAKDLLIR